MKDKFAEILRNFGGNLNYLFDLFYARANPKFLHMRFCRENWREKRRENWRTIGAEIGTTIGENA